METLPKLSELSRPQLEALAQELWINNKQLDNTNQDLQEQLIHFLMIPHPELLEIERYVSTLSVSDQLVFPSVESIKSKVSATVSEVSPAEAKATAETVSPVSTIGPEITAKDLKVLLRQHEIWVTTDRALGEQFHLRDRHLAPQVSLRGAWLLGADLRGADLSNRDMQEANLIRADLSGAQLSHARLEYASLVLCNLNETQCAHANFNSANLGMANLHHANLSDASAERANFQYAHLDHANLQSANLKHSFFIEARLDNCNLSLAKLDNADLTGATLKNTALEGAQMRGTSLKDAKGLTAEKMTQVKFDSETTWPIEELFENQTSRRNG